MRSFIQHVFIVFLASTFVSCSKIRNPNSNNTSPSKKSSTDTPGKIPEANDSTIELAEDSSEVLLLDASDPDSENLKYIIVQEPSHGSLGGTAPFLVYTPSPNFAGSDKVMFKVSDGKNLSKEATIWITVHPGNDEPISQSQSLSLHNDTSLAIELNGSDIDGDELIFILNSSPQHGVLSGTPPNLLYTPYSGYEGSDSFEFHANDGLLDSDTALISISVLPPANKAPIVSSQSLSLNEDESLSILLTGSDEDGDALSYVIVSAPSHGSLSGSPPNISYTPVGNYNGADSFSFKANDGAADSNTATVSLTVDPINDAPLADGQGLSVDEDNSLAISLTGSDPDGDAISFVIASAPSHGSLSGSLPNISYTPEANYNGSDSFTFKSSDGVLDSNIAAIFISVESLNDVPTADTQSLSLDEDDSLAIVLNASDDDGDTLSYTIVSAPSHGVLSGTPPNISYTPEENYNGADSFSFKVNDGATDSNTATVSLTINPLNDIPVADSQSLSLDENTSLAITLTASDEDGDSLSYSLVSPPSQGTISGTLPDLTYTPNSNYSGADSFDFKANDGSADSDIATVSLTVNNINQAPVAEAQSLSTLEDLNLSILLSGSDADGDTLSYSIVSQPSHGTLSGTLPNIEYSPDNEYSGSDSFVFKVNDGIVDSASATVSISIDNVNDAPVADSQSVSTNEEQMLSITLTGSDSEGASLSFVLLTSPSNGVLTGTAPNLSYYPNNGFVGSDSFDFKVNDGNSDSEVVRVDIQVNAINHAPVALAQSIVVPQDTSRSVVLSGSDADSDPLSFVVVSSPSNGSLSGSAPNLSYTPHASYVGSDSFSFKVNDGELDSAVSIISIDVGSSANPIDPSTSVVSLSQNAIMSGDVVTVTLVGKDSSALPIDHGADSVEFFHREGQSSGTFSSVTDHGNGSYSATFTGEVAGTATKIMAKINGVLVSTPAPELTVSVAELSLADSIIVLSDNEIYTGESATIRIFLRDSNGNLFADSGLIVDLSHSGGDSDGNYSAALYQPEGYYESSFTATQPGTVINLAALVNGSPISGNSPTLLVRSPPSATSVTAPSGLIAWFKADVLALVDGDPVDAWTDSSSGSNHATASGITRPTFRLNQANGLPLVDFQFNQFMDANGVANDLAAVSGYSGQNIFVVSKVDDPDIDSQSVVNFHAGSGFDDYGRIEYNSNGHINYRANNESSDRSSTVALDHQRLSVHSFRFTNSGKQYEAWSDGLKTLDSSGSASGDITQVDRFVLGGDYDSGGTVTDFLSGAIGEIIVFSQPLNEAERENIEDYLNYKWQGPDAAISYSQSSISAGHSSLLVGNTTPIILQIRDSQGHRLIAESGHQIDFDVVGEGNGYFSTVLDNGDGSYGATFYATKEGSLSIVARVDSVELSSEPLNLEVIPSAPSLQTLIAKNSVWKYEDSGSAPPSGWNSPSFDDSSWSAGEAPLGWSNNVTTTISNGTNNYLTAYFRHSFMASSVSNFSKLKLLLSVDDGAAVYLNGSELMRDNLPNGPLDEDTTARKTVGGSDETDFEEFLLPLELLSEGSNTIAIEVHNAELSSSDMNIDLELSMFKEIGDPPPIDGPFVAINDHLAGSNTHANANTLTQSSSSETISGLLQDIDAAANTGVTMEIRSSGVSFQDFHGSPNSGSDADTLFGNYVDFSSGSGQSIELDNNDFYTTSFSGLNPQALYTVVVTTVRGGGYGDRWTLFSIEGVESYLADHSSGSTSEIRDSSDDTADIAPHQVAINTGANSSGMVARYKDISPGSDGRFLLKSQQYTGGSGTNGQKGYGHTAVMLTRQ